MHRSGGRVDGAGLLTAATPVRRCTCRRSLDAREGQCPGVPPSQIREREVGRPAERQRDTDWLSVRATNAGAAAQHSEAMGGAARRQAHRPVAESAVLRVARRAAVSDKGSGRKVPPTANEARAKGRCHSCTCTEREGQSRICRGRQRSAATATRDVAARRKHDDRPACDGYPLALEW